MKRLLAAALLAALSGCSLLSASINQAQQDAATAVVQSSERVICRDIPIGTWMRMYSTDADRREAWRALCAPKQEAPAGK